ncbi:MAG: hypothetical protein ACRES4_01605 [Nevskiales bacterium]
MGKASGWKLGLGLAALLAGGLIAYVLYDSGSLPGLSPASIQAGGPTGRQESAYWLPQEEPAADITDPAQIAAIRAQAQTEEQRERYKPWGIKPDFDDPNLSEEQKNTLEAEWDRRKQAFKGMPREQKKAIKQQCRQRLQTEPEFDCSTLWMNNGGAS